MYGRLAYIIAMYVTGIYDPGMSTKARARKMSPPKQDDRIDARLSPEHKVLLKRAADLLGQPLSQFLVASAIERATAVIEQHARTSLSAENARRFLAIMDEEAPNEALVKATRRYKARHGR